MTFWAGSAGEGSRFHPRVGDEVCINFFEGDIDRPFVAGSIYESSHPQTSFDKKGQVPDTKKLSGIRTREVDGEGFNQLRFDDTTGQISAQLQSSHAATQLNLGNLSHPKDKATSNGRGEGFELRTDAYGALRAGKGMLISTYAQEKAVADHLDAVQAQNLLNQANASIKMLSDLAVKQQTDALNVVSRLPKLIQSLELKNTSQALQATLNLFKEGIASDPVNALKDCAGFINDIGQHGGIGEIAKEFNQFLGSATDAVDNLKGFIENIEDFGTDQIKNKLNSIKDDFKNDPFAALQSVGNTLSSVSLNDFNLGNLSSALTGGSGLGGLLNTAQSFMSGFNKDTEQGENTSAENQSNGTLFRQALMLFASPNGIAMTTPEDIVSHAGQEIGFSSGGSTNLSSQKNILMHAQGKYSAFAVNGISMIAANEKIQMHAQNALMELFARLDIKITATEGKILITSPIEVDIKAGGSQLLINQQGVFVNTDRYFKVQSGQHVFMSGMKVNFEVPELPGIGPYAVNFLFSSLAGTGIENAKIEMYEPENKKIIWEGKTDLQGISELSINEESKNYEALIGFDNWSSVFEDIDYYDEEDEIDIGSHGTQIESEIIKNRKNYE